MKSISILIPCYNEEKCIERIIESCLKQTVAVTKIVIVDDGSRDNTRKILNNYKSKKKFKIIFLPKNTGNKSYVQEKGLKYVKTEFFVTADADTLLDPNFIKYTLPHFKDPTVAAVSGYVKSIPFNILTASRELEYFIGQEIHKRAQVALGAMLVIPGCAGVFRTKFFKKEIKFDHDTLTEDLDFTYKIHKLGKQIQYEPKAVVFTQDPSTLKSYINQMRRWYAGGWQNLRKHQDIVLKKPGHAIEVPLIYAEGLLFSVLVFILPFINMKTALIYLAINVGFTFIMAIVASIQKRRLDVIVAAPVRIGLSYVNSYVFFEQFVKEIVLRKKNLEWFHPERRSIA
jgi:cellulose synthase/poly-beta-1,6-N-acetylglucosamine synthase-like glycosyltransferase